MKISNLGLIVAVSYFVVTGGKNAVIHSDLQNVTVPLGRTTLVNFSCHGDGNRLLWMVNGTRVQSSYPERGIIFLLDDHLKGIITIGINVTTKTNNTMLNCRAENSTTNITSKTAKLTIAGPPLAPHPKFRVVNATHVEVQWDKPFALPEFDVRNYTLLIANTSSDGDTQSRSDSERFPLSANTSYPIRYYISNGGDIPKECVYLNFTIIAISDAGTSDAGSVTGGFPIGIESSSYGCLDSSAPSPILDDAGSVQHRVTFTSDFIPTLHITFRFPKVCNYHDAKYSVMILNEDGSLAYQSMEKTYDKGNPDNVEFMPIKNLQKDSSYTAQINVSTAVNWTTTQFKFDTNITPNKPAGIDGMKRAADDLGSVIIISSSVAAALFAILLGLITVILVAFIMRRRKLKQRNKAHQRELETDEAVQRAAQAMVPNPIYSGNPIYEEIVDSSQMLKSLRNGVVASEATLKDEGYVAISADAVKYVSSFPLPEESKLVEDKYTTFPEDTYTVMNPAGTLSNQSRGPACDVPSMHNPMHNGNGVFQEPHPLIETTAAMTNGGHCAAAAGSATVTASFTTQGEERYVKGAF